MQVTNLDQLDVKELTEKIAILQQRNPAIVVKTFPMSEVKKENDHDKMLQKILNKLDKLERKVDLIFGGHVIIDGSYRKI